MNDHLKKYIDSNRAAFDSESPGPDVFKKIQQNLYHTPVSQKSWHPLRWAAIITGIILLSGSFYFLGSRNNNAAMNETEEQLITSVKKAESNFSLIGNNSYAKQISQFQVLIGLKQDELKQLKAEYPDLYNQFVNDITELDSSYQSLKIKLAETPNREMLLEAMIQNLQLQSELLNRQLLIIKEIKQKTKSHANNDA
jgi:hypothetical protein